MRVRQLLIILMLLFSGAQMVLADEAKSIFIINNIVDKIKTTRTLSRKIVYEIEHEVLKYEDFVYGFQIVAYLWAGLHDYQRSYHYYNEALKRITIGIAILFYDVESSIFVKKEDLLFNMALVSYALSNPDFADSCIAEAITIANCAHRKATGDSTIISPRAKVFDAVRASKGVEFLPIQPCFEKIQMVGTLLGRPSEIPWTIDDDYESADPILTAPIRKIRQDSVGAHNFGEQRFPRRIKMSSVHLIPRAEE